MFCVNSDVLEYFPGGQKSEKRYTLPTVYEREIEFERLQKSKRCYCQRSYKNENNK